MNFFVAFAAIVGVLVVLMASPSEAKNLCTVYCPPGQPPVCAYIGHGQYMTFDGLCEAINHACEKGVPAYNPITNHACDPILQGSDLMMNP